MRAGQRRKHSSHPSGKYTPPDSGARRSTEPNMAGVTSRVRGVRTLLRTIPFTGAPTRDCGLRAGSFAWHDLQMARRTRRAGQPGAARHLESTTPDEW